MQPQPKPIQAEIAQLKADYLAKGGNDPGRSSHTLMYGLRRPMWHQSIFIFPQIHF
jgi:hypothetical protein